ncbi:MAG: O-antigen ligase family protein [Parcubacteria group bacterium]|nr:O-antigen ligase family protein [Parcubacteria group bacterium]
MTLKTYLNILRTGVYLSFLSVFLVFSNLLFPFITSKQIFFNVLMEILAVVWLGLIIKYPETRPKKSWITFGLIAFFSALLVSSLFGVDFNLSFWGDIERMLGWFHIAHFFIFYLIVITVFRDWRDWRNLFIISVMAAAAVCLYALVKTPISTIGNTAYVSGYAIFNFYFALILFFRSRGQEKSPRQNWLAALYLIAAFIMLLVMKVTHTRGAYVGLGASFLLFFILYGFYSRSKKVKIYSLAVLAATIIGAVLIFSFPQSAFVNKSEILRTAIQINSQAVTFQTRLISWKAAFKDFPNHVLLGTGYGNYAITFDKYFDPSFYNYTSSETYFDRAHNNLVDLASTAGLTGLLAYLSILAAVGYYLFKGKRSGKISTNEFILLVCLLTAYFIQNLAVFDSLVTYISLIITLGYVYWLFNAGETEEFSASQGLTNQELAALAVAGLIFLSVIYQYNLKVFKMLDGTIKGQTEFARGDLAAGVAEYKKALSYKTPLDRDSRASLINVINGRQEALTAMDKATAKDLADYAVNLAEANVKLNSLDSMMQMQLAQTLNTAAIVNQDNQNKFYFYSDRALKAMDESIKASPGRITIYFSKAQLYLTRNDKDNAIKTLQDAYNLNKKYSDSACYLAKAAIYFRDEETGYEALDQCLDLGGAGSLYPADFIKVALNYYTIKKDQPRILALYERWSQLEPSNAKILVNLSLLYAQAGRKDEAIAAAEKAGALDPSLKAAAEEFIRKLKNQ